MSLAAHVAFLVAVPDDTGGLSSPQLVETEQAALRMMDQLNAAQCRFDGTEPWRVFPVGEPFSNDRRIRKNREYKKQRRHEAV